RSPIYGVLSYPGRMGAELDLPMADVDALLAEHYGLRPRSVTRLESELSTVCRVGGTGSELVLKASAYSPDTLAATRWRADAMERVRRSGVPVGRTVPGLDGELVPLAATRDGAAVLQLIDWLDGVPLMSVAPDRRMLQSVGDTAARVARALADHPAPPVPVSH